MKSTSPKVIEFKTDTMAQLGAEPTAERRTVSIDLREDWPTALRESGFDDTKPAAWSAEGLLMYLPPEAQDRLFDHITALSAPGSQLATEYHPEYRSDDGRTRSGDERSVGQSGLRRRLVGAVLRGRRGITSRSISASGVGKWSPAHGGNCSLTTVVTFPTDDELAAFRNIVSVIATRSWLAK